MSITGGGLAGHGGRLCVARALYPHAPEPWIDLSTGINPEPYADVRASAAARARLPMLEETRALESTAGRMFGVADADRIAAAAGSETVLRLMPYALPPGSAAVVDGATASSHATAVVVGPTYSSHAAAWRRAGVRVSEMSDVATCSRRAVASGFPTGADGLSAAEVMARVGAGSALDVVDPIGAASAVEAAVGAVGFARAVADLSPHAVTLVNPNNPDGAVIDRERLLELHDELASRGGYLVVDEAFADLEPACSVASLAGGARCPRLIVLRSFGKFYGLAGVRLGFVIAGPSIIARFRELLGDWPVSADAIAVGLAAYADDAWAERTRERLKLCARRLDELLQSAGLDIVGGTSLFRLARSDEARERFENLLRAGVLARPFDHDPTLLRFGLPNGPAAWQRLAEALR